MSTSRSFSLLNSIGQPDPSKSPISPIFNFVKKTGSSLRNKLVKVRQLATSSQITKTEPCDHKNCSCCSMIATDDIYAINNIKIKPAPGTCSSYNLIYIFMCTACHKNYIGRTTRFLRVRVNEHRHKFYSLLEKPELSSDDDSDAYSLGAHLVDDHNCKSRSDFNKFYEIFILMNCSPGTLEVNEHKFIQKLRTIKPFGINSSDPFGIPLLND